MASAPRPLWKGHLRFSLVTIPVRAYSASTPGAAKVQFNQLHRDCGARIRYVKFCPVHGEVPAREIVKGYQYAKDEYVVLEDEEIRKACLASEATIGIEAFIDPDRIDPVHYQGKTQYLLPDGPIARKPYALLYKGLVEEKKFAFAQTVRACQPQAMLIRPMGGVLGMTYLTYEEEVKPASQFDSEVPATKLTAQEMSLTKMLMNELGEEGFDFSQFRNTYAENLRKLIDAKIEGREIVSPPEEEAPRVINLMEALQKSLEAAKGKAGSKKPPKLTAPSTAEKATRARKRKSS